MEIAPLVLDGGEPRDPGVPERRDVRAHRVGRDSDHPLPRWMLHPQPIGLDGEEIETGCELKGLALRRTYG